MRCPKCSHNTFTKKWGTCTAEGCSLNHSVIRSGATLVTGVTNCATVQVTEVITTPVTKKPALNVTGKRGRPSKPDALSAAERQRISRARKKATV